MTESTLFWTRDGGIQVEVGHLGDLVEVEAAAAIGVDEEVHMEVKVGILAYINKQHQLLLEWVEDKRRLEEIELHRCPQ